MTHSVKKLFMRLCVIILLKDAFNYSGCPIADASNCEKMLKRVHNFFDTDYKCKWLHIYLCLKL